MVQISLFRPRPISTLYRRERNNFNLKFYKDYNEEVGNLRVCWDSERIRLRPKTPPEERDK
ncbi:MAG: hypothetical protein AABW86_05220 [Candidatus Micrarchaeota archaeon]